MPEFIILIDSREQKKYTFENVKPKPKTKIVGLKTGDYSLAGFQHTDIIIERKELSDLFSSVGKGRVRFEKELIRMASFDYACIIIEAEIQQWFLLPPSKSKMNPKSILRTLIAWSQRYSVYIWPAWSRESAEKLTYLILRRYFDDYVKGINGLTNGN